jgi:hypothetical protein
VYKKKRSEKILTNETNKWIAKAFIKLRKDYGDRCYFCSSTFQLEFAHVLPTKLNGRGRGRKERYYDIINNRDKYLLTCKNHNYLAEINSPAT